MPARTGTGHARAAEPEHLAVTVGTPTPGDTPQDIIAGTESPWPVAEESSLGPRLPNVARVYDALLDGKDNYAADRAAARRLAAVVPGAAAAARANRDFLARAVGFLAGPAGIDQFLDIGVGLPAASAVHEVARKVNPQAQVVYADNDPVVAAHARARLADSPGVAAVEGDVRYPRHLLTMREVRAVIDFDRPVAVLLLAVLHFVADSDDPWAAVRCITGQLAPGSYLVISHVTGDALSDVAVRAASRVYDGALASLTARSLAQVTRFFAGMEVVEPGVVDVARWRRPARGRSAPPVLLYGGVGRKGGELS